MSHPLDALVDELADRVCGRLLRDGGAVLADKIAERLAVRQRDQLLDVNAIAERWGVEPATARKRLERHEALSKLCIPMGRRRLWRVSDLDAVDEAARAERSGGVEKA